MKRPRTPAKLTESIHQQLNAYVLAASAAGVGMLALVPTTECLIPSGIALAGMFALPELADAKIVYTPASQEIVCGSKSYDVLKLDLNHAKRADFKFRCFVSSGGDSNSLGISPIGKNGFEGEPLSSGVLIGPRGKFYRTEKQMCFWDRVSMTFSYHGPWCNVANGYLGVKFFILGKAHYGWARLTVTKAPGLLLTGYAYESIPGKPIIAGKTKGPDDDVENDNPDASLTNPVPDIPQPASLGALALGAPGLSIWRRKELVEAGQ